MVNELGFLDVRSKILRAVNNTVATQNWMDEGVVVVVLDTSNLWKIKIN